MTEAEWLECGDATAMQRFLWHRVTERKFRLLGCHCCREIWSLLVDARARRAIEVAEQYCEGLAGAVELRASNVAAWDVYLAVAQRSANHTPEQVHAAYAVCLLTAAKPNPPVAHVINITRGAAAPLFVKLIRCMFGNPFRAVPFHPEWRTQTVLILARQMSDSRDFSAMPILADALQDAGCDDTDVLTHCRESGAHVRGCWVVDLLLDKS
jgi:hypothetical protein